MVPVRADGEIDRKSAASADLSFFGMESPPRNDGSSTPGLDFEKSRVVELDSSGGRIDREGGVSVKASEARVSRSEVVRADSAALEKSKEADEVEPSWMNGFKVGDMVWGKVKSHPWWPGHIFNEAFASSSVRRTKREGHVLVAFFGDSSYGWFDPSELIHFEPHFAEKSKQTASRPFVKAVEEAVDEASRRGAVGTACCCRNKNNFRPTAVPGYFSVDVVGFEPGGIYSSKQIEKARGNFVPAETCSFLHQLAMSPHKNESSRSIEWVQSFALLLSLRRARFEEFDDTYAQAFGVQPVRPPRNDSGVSDQLNRFASRALSGPLRIAENLGDNRISNKSSSKPKKKNKYVLKRRDEAPIPSPLPEVLPIPQPHGTPSMPFDLAPGPEPQAARVISTLQAFRDAAAAGAAVPSVQSTDTSQIDDYVLQKRPVEKPQPHQNSKKDSEDGGQKSTLSKARKERAFVLAAKTVAADSGGSLPPNASSPPKARTLSVWDDFDDQILKSQQAPPVTAEKASSSADASKPTMKPGSPAAVIDKQKEKPDNVLIDAENAGIALPGDSLPPKSEVPARPKDHIEMVASVDSRPQTGRPQEPKVLDGGVMKEKAKKRPTEEMPDGKKKKKKKIVTVAGDGAAMSRDEPRQKKAIAKSVKPAIERIKLGETEQQRMDTDVVNASTSSGPNVPPPKLDLDSHNLQLPDLLSDLTALAMNPFHGIERNAPDIVRHAFMKFRTVVYEKSLVIPSADEADLLPARTVKPATSRPPSSGAEDTAAKKGKAPREPEAASKQVRPSLRPDDPTKAGRKRLPSDRQEEISAQRLKKLKQLKALSNEKKAAMSQKEASTSAKPVKRQEMEQQVKKKNPPRSLSRTFLTMKFPPNTSLPSIACLRARFTRFGPLETSGTRVFWRSHSCRVLFKYKEDAEVAFNHINGSDAFGQFKVNCYLRGAELPGREPPSEPEKLRLEQRPDAGPQFRPGNVIGGPVSQPRPPLYQQQPKSILKKTGEEAGPSGSGVAKERPSVKFMLDANDGRRETPVSVPNNGIGGGSSFDMPLPSLSLPEPISKKKSVNFLPPPPPSSFTHSYPPQSPLPHPSHATNTSNVHRFPSVPPPSAPLPQPARVPEMRRFTTLPPPPPLPPRQILQQLPVSLPPPPPFPPQGAAVFKNRGPLPSAGAQPYRYPQNHQFVNRENRKPDIAHQLVNLMLRCMDIVTNAQSSLGHAPYRPL